jgi:mycobactin lysine-N-oxygenase
VPSQIPPATRAPGPDPSRTPEVILVSMPTLAVIGAGPKGIATAAKARALAAAGLAAPRVVLIDRGAVAGNWTGRQGYTSGLLPLARNFVFFHLPWEAAAVRLSVQDFTELADRAAWPAWFLEP